MVGSPEYDLNLNTSIEGWDFLEFLSKYLVSYFHLGRIYVQSNHTHTTESHGRVVNGFIRIQEVPISKLRREYWYID